jgi:hypothetical protein
MIIVDSIYKYLIKYNITEFPIWKVHGLEFSIYPQSMEQDLLSDTTNCSFRIVCDQYYKNIKLNTWKIISKKAKDFIFTSFKELLEYNESISKTDKYIEINIVVYGKK